MKNRSPCSAFRLFETVLERVDVEYLRVLHAHGYGGAAVNEWIRLWAAGVPSEFIDTAARALKERCSATEMIRLWLTGVDAPMLRRLCANA